MEYRLEIQSVRVVFLTTLDKGKNLFGGMSLQLILVYFLYEIKGTYGVCKCWALHKYFGDVGSCSELKTMPLKTSWSNFQAANKHFSIYKVHK